MVIQEESHGDIDLDGICGDLDNRPYDAENDLTKMVYVAT